MRNPSRASATFTLLCAALACGAGGCSLNDSGALATRISHGDGALVYTSYAPGLSVRTRSEETGATLGMAVRTCIAQLTADAPPAGLYWLRAPDHPAHCYARHLRAWGGELRTSPPDVSFGVGYRESALFAHARLDESVDYALDYAVASPSATHLEVHDP